MLTGKHRLPAILIVLLALTPALVIPAAAQNGVTTTDAAYQEFQGGAMLWREDTGTVYVMVHAPAWTLQTFPQSSYENLPDLPIEEAPPEGFVAPANAFKRVWIHAPEVRAALGWPFDAEQAIQAQFGPASTTAGGFAQFKVSVLGEDFVFREDGTWGFYGLPRTISSLPAATSFRASAQPFQGGMLHYWSETGTILVLEDDGSYKLFESHSYGALPENPVTDAPPPGYTRPILGFGKVWGNIEVVREALGWANGPETSYRMHFERSLTGSGAYRVAFRVNLPDGRTISLRDNGTWVTVG